MWNRYADAAAIALILSAHAPILVIVNGQPMYRHRGAAPRDIEDSMSYDAISFDEKFARFSETFKPKVIAQMNDYQFKLARVEGDFVWHQHEDTDEAFIVIEGEMRIDFRDGSVTLREGEMFVVPRGVEHKPFAAAQTKIMLIEPAGTRNTGDAGGAMTAPDDVWI